MKTITITNLENSTKYELIAIETAEGAEPVTVKIEYDIPEKVGFKTCADALAYMAQTEDTIKALCIQWEEANTLDNGTEIAKTIMEHASELAKLYNSASSQEAMRDCSEHEKPLLYAATRMLYPTISVREAEDKESKGHFFLDMVKRDRRINIEKLHKAVDGGIGEDKQWIYTAQAVNKIFTARLIVGVGKIENAPDALRAVDESYHMHEIAKKISLGENPISNSKTLDQLRLCISQMIGAEYAPKLISHDVKYLTSLYAKENKKNAYGVSLEAATHKRFYDLLLRVCYHLVTNTAYDVVFKENK